MPAVVPAIAARQGGVFTYQQVLASGVSPAEVRAAVASGRWHRLWRGVYADGSCPPSRRLQLYGATLLCPAAIGSHATALTLHGCQIPVAAAVQVTVAPASTWRSRRGLTVHRRFLSSAEVCHDAGIRITTPVRALVDFARTAARRDSIQAGDEVLRRQLVQPAELAAYLSGPVTGAGAALAREALGACRYGADSAMETLLRLVLVDGGLPEPELQIPILTRHGWCFADMGWRWYRICAEYDGRDPHSTIAQFERDRRRWRDLDDAGWLVLPFSAGDLCTPGRVVEEVVSAMARRRAAS